MATSNNLIYSWAAINDNYDFVTVKVNGNGKVILDTHPESDQHQN